MSTESQAEQGSGVYRQATTVVATFGGIQYYVDQGPAQAITFKLSSSSDRLCNGLKGDLLPCTVISGSRSQLNKEDLDRISVDFAAQDDVWTPTFLQCQFSCCEFEVQTRVTKNLMFYSTHTSNAPDL